MNIRTAYDKVPYEGASFPQSHPDRLCMFGRLYGMSPAPVIRCRVLELGCGWGGNLIPMAWHLPESEFVGLDLSVGHVEKGLSVIHDLGLRNIRIEHASILSVDDSWGYFDYIIAHGVFSWVTHEVQNKILSICSKNLAPQGIAYVSYNTYPGWHMRGMIRNMMLYHSGKFDEADKKLEESRALINFLSEAVPSADYYGMLLKSEMEIIKGSKDWYLFHDHLGELNSPLYFHEFMERAGGNELQYLCESEFPSTLTSGLPEKVVDTLNRLSRNTIESEQYTDFIRNVFFRQTLLCHSDVSLRQSPAAESLEGVLVSSHVRSENMQIDLAPGVKQIFKVDESVSIETDTAPTKTALVILSDHWPRSIHFDSLREEISMLLWPLAKQSDAWQHQMEQTLMKDLLHYFAARVVRFRTWQADFVTETSNRPKVSELAVYLASRDLPVVNQLHEVIRLDLLARQLIPFLDGTRDKAALFKQMNKLVSGGTLVVGKEDNTATDTEEIRQSLIKGIDEALESLSLSALLIS